MVSLEEALRAEAFESEALLNLLERKDLITKSEVLEEARRLKDMAASARSGVRRCARGTGAARWCVAGMWLVRRGRTSSVGVHALRLPAAHVAEALGLWSSVVRGDLEGGRKHFPRILKAARFDAE